MTNKQKKEEKKLEKFLKGLYEIVFIAETDSVSGKRVKLEPKILDMEATIRICGEFDREDLKELLNSL